MALPPLDPNRDFEQPRGVTEGVLLVMGLDFIASGVAFWQILFADPLESWGPEHISGVRPTRPHRNTGSDTYTQSTRGT